MTEYKLTEETRETLLSALDGYREHVLSHNIEEAEQVLNGVHPVVAAEWTQQDLDGLYREQKHIEELSEALRQGQVTVDTSAVMSPAVGVTAEVETEQPLSEAPNAAVANIDERFPDDLEKRHLARSVSGLLEDEKGIEHEASPALPSRAYAYAMEEIAAGRTNTDSIVEEAISYQAAVGQLDAELGEDPAVFAVARDHAEALIKDGNTDADHVATRSEAYGRGVEELVSGADDDRSREKQALAFYYDRIDEVFPGEENFELRRQGYERGINYATENIGRHDTSMFDSAAYALIDDLREEHQQAQLAEHRRQNGDVLPDFDDFTLAAQEAVQLAGLDDLQHGEIYWDHEQAYSAARPMGRTGSVAFEARGGFDEVETDYLPLELVERVQKHSGSRELRIANYSPSYSRTYCGEENQYVSVDLNEAERRAVIGYLDARHPAEEFNSEIVDYWSRGDPKGMDDTFGFVNPKTEWNRVGEAVAECALEAAHAVETAEDLRREANQVFEGEVAYMHSDQWAAQELSYRTEANAADISSHQDQQWVNQTQQSPGTASPGIS